ncbi:MAG: phosphocholine cytidylyltransferase family protein [Gammaproteobacteria bacterium]|nr:phosphocholine cytidylyltransferase family protein [Gammaproteobacteria bacterium]
MQAIILAAGIGSRLRPITDHKPKTLTKVGNTEIIFRTIDTLTSKGVGDIIIVVGYKKELIIKAVEERYPNLKVKFVINHDFETTNNSYSLYLAREFLGCETLVMDSDLVFDPTILPDVLNIKGSSAAVDKSQYLEESMKVKVKDGIITSISKKITAEFAYACSVDIFKFIPSDSNLIRQALIDTVEKQNQKTLWVEYVWDGLCQSGELRITPFDVNGRKWVEIDDATDLALAEELFDADSKK